MRTADNEPFTMQRDARAVIVPAGVEVNLKAGQSGYITQSLGGSFTLYIEGNLFRLAGEDAVQTLAARNVHHVESDVLAKADVGVTIAAIDGEREDTALAHAGHAAHEGIVARAEDVEVGLGAEVGESSVEAGNGVVGGEPGGEAVDHIAGRGVDDEEPAVGAAIPPAGGDVEFAAIGRDAGAVTAGVVLAIPENLLGFEVECAEAAVGGGVIDGVTFGVAAKTAQSFLEDGHIDAADEAMPVINVEDEDAGAGTALLRAVGRAQVEIAPGFSRERFEKLQAMNPEEWRREILSQDELFMKIYQFLPKDMIFQRELLVARL